MRFTARPLCVSKRLLGDWASSILVLVTVLVLRGLAVAARALVNLASQSLANLDGPVGSARAQKLLPWLEIAVQWNNGDDPAFWQLGQARFGQAQLDAARAAIERALALDPTSMEVRLLLQTITVP
jgi:cytochrome c-type biogenesis protein CcmH/NrfG